MSNQHQIPTMPLVKKTETTLNGQKYTQKDLPPFSPTVLGSSKLNVFNSPQMKPLILPKPIVGGEQTPCSTQSSPSFKIYTPTPLSTVSTPNSFSSSQTWTPCSNVSTPSDFKMPKFVAKDCTKSSGSRVKYVSPTITPKKDDTQSVNTVEFKKFTPTIFKSNIKTTTSVDTPSFVYKPPTFEKVQLFDKQKPNVERGIKILRDKPFFIDTSIMGAGKTHMTSSIIQEMKPKHVIVIYGPGATAKTWKDVSSKYGLPVRQFISYESLASRTITENLLTETIYKRYGYSSFGTCKHGLLYRGTDKLNSLFYSITPLMEKYISEGLIFVCDEFAKIKNSNTANYKAVKSVISVICASMKANKASKSRAILLSACPFTAAKQKVSFMRMVGIITSTNLCRSNKNNIQLLGIREVIDFCNKINRDKTSDILSGVKIEKKNSADVCAALFDNIIMSSYSSAAPGMETIDVTVRCVDDYRNISPNRRKDLDYSLAYLNGLVKEGVNGHAPVVDWKGVESALPMLEYSKVEIFHRVTREKLNKDKNSKVCIMVNYIASLCLLKEYLSDFNPLIMQGLTKMSKRGEIIEKFNQPNSEHRLIICIMSVACMGINLQDSHGGFPRTCYISPNYMVANMHQASFRFHRIGTKSDSYVHFIYGKTTSKESSILRTISRASPQMKSSVVHQVAHDVNVRFPGEYDTIYEEDPLQQIPYLNYRIEGFFPTGVHSPPSNNTTGKSIHMTKFALTGKKSVTPKNMTESLTDAVDNTDTGIKYTPVPINTGLTLQTYNP